MTNRRKLNVRETRRVLQDIPFNKLLGMRVWRIHRDGITIESRIVKRLMNSAGVLHGGVCASLADAAVGIALHRYLGDHHRITTVEMKINYFRPVKDGRVFARSHLLRVGSTLCVGRVDLFDARTRAVATALVTYMILGSSQNASS
jgi:uncharacterized protein (TIGR00369 family)